MKFDKAIQKICLFKELHVKSKMIQLHQKEEEEEGGEKKKTLKEAIVLEWVNVFLLVTLKRAILLLVLLRLSYVILPTLLSFVEKKLVNKGSILLLLLGFFFDSPGRSATSPVRGIWRCGYNTCLFSTDQSETNLLTLAILYDLKLVVILMNSCACWASMATHHFRASACALLGIM